MTEIDGYVYVVQNGDGLVKIGRTRDFSARLKGLLTASASDLARVAVWPCENSAQHEASTHQAWSDCRVRGEWFRIPEHVLAIWSETDGQWMPAEDNDDAWFDLVNPP